MIILWAFVGLIAIALFAGPGRLSDPDTVWGATSKLLLGPGFRGLMVAGILAADMSSLGAQTVTVAGMFVRNLYGPSHPDRTAARSVGTARIAMIAVLTLSILVATLMSNLKSIMLLILYGNVGFGAAIFMLFHWRRLTAAAVWWCVTLSLLVGLVVPFGAQFVPSLRSNPQFVQMSAKAEDVRGGAAPLYFDSVAPTVSDDPSAMPVGRGRFNFELYLLSCAGLHVRELSAGGILAAQLFFDGLFPFAVLIGVSWLTSSTAPDLVDRFYGKMKTPVGATPELEKEAIEETMRYPSRFDHLKLFPRSDWEFCRWTREDAVGFLLCCGVSGAILGSFWLLLRALA
jgi:hypothetical protein